MLTAFSIFIGILEPEEPERVKPTIESERSGRQLALFDLANRYYICS